MYSAATAFDEGEPAALPAVLSVKAEVAQSATHVTNEAMTLAGGRAYGQNSELARLLRDVRAAHVMAPTTDFLRLWVGRSVLGEPMLADEVG
jgi:alkylation response protein AidB-like acyl-CoA dehydrogenase